MTKLLTRDEFRSKVFERDLYTCVWCGKDAVDAHHIIDRSLFDDGGYYLENGASLCEHCHLDAEYTLISPKFLWQKIGVKPFLPEHFDPDLEYTKWGDIINPDGTRIKGELFYAEQVQKILSVCNLLGVYLPYVKYPRTYHLPWSENLKNDDRGLENCNHFVGKEVVVSEKLDGENTTGYWDGKIHARSIDSDNHPSRNLVKGFLTPKIYQLPKDWRVCGENMYAKHSIFYQHLKSYFYVFSVWNELNHCLSWDDMVETCQILNLEVVPVIYRGIWDEEKIRSLKREYNDNGDQVEGYVVRLAEGFPYRAFRKSVAKFVRKNHVQTSKFWRSEAIVPNELEK
jgi:hypothetical protein